MKTRLFYNTLAFAVCAMAVTSCSENIVDETLNEGLKPLSISVVDEGYINADASSRAVDNGVTTTFENGDQIGVYVVKAGAINQSNIPVTYDGATWSGNIFYFEGSDYIAYYPYDATLGDYTNIDELKAALSANASTDQTDEASYRKADYLTSIQSGVSSTDPLTFSMAHNKSLVEVNIPVCTGATNDAVSDLNITVGGTSYKPYYIGNGMFRCVVTPSEEVTTVGGVFVDKISGNLPVNFSTEITPAQNAYNRLMVTYEGMTKLLWSGDYFQGGNADPAKSEIILPSEIVSDVVVAKLFGTPSSVTAEVLETPEWLTIKSEDGFIKVSTTAVNEATNKENVATIKVTVDEKEYTMTVRQCMNGYGTILNKKLWNVSIEGCTVVNNDGVGRLDAIYDNKWSSSTDTKLYIQLLQSNSSENCIIIIDLGENRKEYNAVALMPRLQWTQPAPGKITVEVSDNSSVWTKLVDNSD